MKICPAKISRAWLARQREAYSMVEAMCAMAIFSLVIIAILACHYAGLEFNEFVRPKVENSRFARESLAQLIEEVRCANSLQVGTGTFSSFTQASATAAQAGNALRIFTTTNLSQYIYYYQDSASQSLMKLPWQATNAIVVATSITNTMPFTMENFGGAVLTNRQNNAVMSVVLQMRRTSGLSRISDAYQVRTKVTRRNIL